jgi:phenylalanyl-tRNA synthetase alpha chain
MDIYENLDAILASSNAEIENSKTEKELEDVRVKYLGKQGQLTLVLRGMKDIEPTERPKVGAKVNVIRDSVESLLLDKQKKLKSAEIENELEKNKIDITAPSMSLNNELGTMHPLTIVKNRIFDFFTSMGFEIVDGREVEEDYYNFEALNIPKDHPARDSQDTFYINDKLLLRSQTSGVQIHEMENKKPPIKMISAGRVYRGDEADATHSPIFSQIEGLVVDEHITLADLNGLLDKLAKFLFGKNVETRMRPSYFPFTEPSIEVDATCVKCGGKGCPTCKGTGWVEILGAGMVNPKVLENCKIDSTKYSGFAFGLGLDRITTRLYGISDLRDVYENDIRFLKQVK